MDPAREFTVDEQDAGLRLDRVLTRRLPGMTRAKIRHLFDASRLRVDGRPPAGPGHVLRGGETVVVTEAVCPADPEPHVLHDDPGFFVAYKTAGVPMTRALTVARRRGDDPAGRDHRPRAVLTLERAVSGVIVGARAAGVRHQLVRQFQGGRGLRRFTVLVRGIVPRASGPLPRAEGWTYRLLERYRDHALLQLLPPPEEDVRPLEALSAAGWPVASLPGAPGPAAAIHGAGVAFHHPRTGRHLRFDPPLPARFAALVAGLPAAPTLAAHLPPEPPGDSAVSRASSDPDRALRSPRAVLQNKPLTRNDS